VTDQTVVFPVISEHPPRPVSDSPTTLIPVTPKEPPVFVDATGRRRRWFRLLAYGFVAAGLVYTVLVGISFVGGPVRPDTVLPFTDPVQPTLPSLPDAVEHVEPALAPPPPTGTRPDQFQTFPRRSSPVRPARPGGPSEAIEVSPKPSDSSDSSEPSDPPSDNPDWLPSIEPAA